MPTSLFNTENPNFFFLNNTHLCKISLCTSTSITGASIQYPTSNSKGEDFPSGSISNSKIKF